MKMSKKKKVLWIAVVFILVFVSLNPTALANGKQGLAHIVQEHSERIANLEASIKNLGSSTDETKLSSDVEEAILFEANQEIDMMNEMYSYDGKHINVTNTEIKNDNGDLIMKIYIEGSYDWTTAESPEGLGRNFARAFISNYDKLSKMYGVNLKYEFYENGERITTFIDVK